MLHLVFLKFLYRMSAFQLKLHLSLFSLPLCLCLLFIHLYFTKSSSWPAPWSARWAVQDQWRVASLQRWVFNKEARQTWQKAPKMYWLFSNCLSAWLRSRGDRQGSAGNSCLHRCNFIRHWKVGWCHPEWGQRQERWHRTGETLLHLWGKSWDIC